MTRTSQLAWDDPVLIGWGDEGEDVTIPLPGTGGRHLLVGGASGSGKSEFLNGLVVSIAPRPHLALVCIDPKRVELSQATARASLVAKGRVVSVKALRRVVREMVRRYHYMDEHGLQTLPIGDDEHLDPETLEPWPFLLTIVDELADLGRGGSRKAGERLELVEEVITLGRAAGLGIVLATQSPDSDACPSRIRNNCRVRIAFGCESFQQADMILGHRAPGMNPHELPDLPGLAIMKRDRRYVRLRTFMVPPGETRHAAEQHATLRCDMGHLGWRHVEADPLPLEDEEED